MAKSKMHPAEGKPMGKAYPSNYKKASKLTGGLPSDKPLRESVHNPKGGSGVHAARAAKDGKVMGNDKVKLRHL